MDYAKKVLKVFALLLGLMALVVVSAAVTMKAITWGRTVAVPAVEGRDLAGALVVLKNAGLEARVERQEHHPSVPAGAVIRQTPAAGAKVKKGRDIRVVVSLGSEEVVVPALAGEVFRRAQVLLKQSGLALGEALRVHSPAAQREVVLVQAPPAQTVVQKGEAVSLLVSGGPRPESFVAPGIVGLTKPQAEAALAALGVTLDAAGQGSYIVAQQPRAGYRIAAGGSVKATLGAKPPAPPAAAPAQPARPGQGAPGAKPTEGAQGQKAVPAQKPGQVKEQTPQAPAPPPAPEPPPPKPAEPKQGEAKDKTEKEAAKPEKRPMLIREPMKIPEH